MKPFGVVCNLLYFNGWQGSDMEDEDMEELLNDTRLLKRLKKGKISEEEFEKRLTGSQSKFKEAAADWDWRLTFILSGLFH